MHKDIVSELPTQSKKNVQKTEQGLFQTETLST